MTEMMRQTIRMTGLWGRVTERRGLGGASDSETLASTGSRKAEVQKVGGRKISMEVKAWWENQRVEFVGCFYFLF